MMPGLKCSSCREVWSGIRVLEFRCPPDWANSNELKIGQPLSFGRFERLDNQISKSLNLLGISAKLRPGDAFQPLHIKLVSPPGNAFLWPTFGCPVVQPWVKEMFESNFVTGVRFVEVVVDKVGTGHIENTDLHEPEDIVDRTPANSRIQEYSPLYQMVVLYEGPYPPGAMVSKSCPRCGYVELNMTGGTDTLSKSEIPQSDIFFMGGTLQIVVKQRIAELIKSSGCGNAELRECRVV
jgi:hypothetical protein